MVEELRFGRAGRTKRTFRMDEPGGNVEVAAEAVAPRRLRFSEVLAAVEEAAVREAYELSAEPVPSICKRASG